MKIPFDIKYRPQIESGEYKVVTRDGHPVRIICWDANGPQPIVGLIYDTDASCDTSEFFCDNGKYWRTNDSDCHYDLFIITPEPELTEFEEMLYSIFDTYNGLKIDVRAAVDANAKTLLAIAKKEICKRCTVGIDQYWKGREDARKEYEKPITFCYPPYPTCQPPCFYGGLCTNPMKDCINCPRQSSGTAINTSETNKEE